MTRRLADQTKLLQVKKSQLPTGLDYGCGGRSWTAGARLMRPSWIPILPALFLIRPSPNLFILTNCKGVVFLSGLRHVWSLHRRIKWPSVKRNPGHGTDGHRNDRINILSNVKKFHDLLKIKKQEKSELGHHELALSYLQQSYYSTDRSISQVKKSL